MLKYKVGDLIKAAQEGEVNVIAQQCNCFNARKSGIAPLIDLAFPSAGRADNETIKGDPNKFGSLSCAYEEEYDLLIFNLYGQWGFWKREDGLCNTDLGKLRSVMLRMHDVLNINPSWSGYKVGLPKLGAGLGGGSWRDIEKIIEETLANRGFDVTIYVLNEKEIPLE